ncbi:MAG: hypothetical protein IT270_19985 [Saprospiraceae bacterium]|nr:hypothetical protein [Saprospiraceae bacterium]
MKMIQRLLFFSLVLVLHGTAQANTVSAVAAENSTVRQMLETELKADSRMEKKIAKKMAKMEKKIKKQAEAIDFSHPTDKWLWYAIFGFGAAIIVGIFFWELASVLALLALICLIVWLVKKSGA